MIREGHVRFTLRTGERLHHVPTHADVLIGAGRPAGRLDGGGQLDRALSRYGGGGRCRTVFHAKMSLGKPGEQHVGYNDTEEDLGLSRTYSVEVADRAKHRDVVKALRDLNRVESAATETLAFTSMAAAGPTLTVDIQAAWRPRQQIHLRDALQMEPGDQRIITAIVDTGIVIGHPEFQRRCMAGYDTVDLGMGRLAGKMILVGDSRGHDYNPYDDVGHGCHVAGIIAARGWSLPPGAGGETVLLPIRVLAAAVNEGATRRVGVGGLCDIDAGMKVAVDMEPAVINMSFGTAESAVDSHGPLPHEQIVRYAARMGCILVAAAGNSGAEERYYPAALPEVICVGSCDHAGKRSRFSTWGKHVSLCAPGEQIISTGRRGYQVNSGTSFASPFVAGVAALLAARASKRRYALQGAEAKRILMDSAAPLGGGGFHPETGLGLLDAVRALRLLDLKMGRAN